MGDVTRRFLMCSVCYRNTGHDREGFGGVLCDLCHEDLLVAAAFLKSQRDRMNRRR